MATCVEVNKEQFGHSQDNNDESDPFMNKRESVIPAENESVVIPIDYKYKLPDSLQTCSPLIPVVQARKLVDQFIQRRKSILKLCRRLILILTYFAYFTGAMIYKFGDEGSILLLALTATIVVCYSIHLFKKKYWKSIKSYFVTNIVSKPHFPDQRTRNIMKRILAVFVVLGILIYVTYSIFVFKPNRLIPAAGIFVFVIALFFCSKDPSQVQWRPVLWGFFLQFIFALIVLRTSWGYYTFDWLGKRVIEFSDHTDKGATFAFGKNFYEHFFAFKVMSVIFFFSATISVLYYLGWMQVLIEKMAFIMQYSLGTSAMESLHAAVNVFVGWAETSTMVKPLLDRLTLSELHTIMTNGFATVAGSTLVVYILYGAPANHLISASIMSAPAALAVSKLFWPEAKENRRDTTNDACVIKREGHNIMDAASVGAITALPLVAYILASVIAFFSLVGFINATLVWFGERIGLVPPEYPSLTFQLICSYVFWPLVFLMGVEPKDCFAVARMVGIKTFINEFFAYEDLGVVIKNGPKLQAYNGSFTISTNGDIFLSGTNETLVGGVISEHSTVIATYALCGFANLTALGIMIGAFTALVPSRKEDIVLVSTRAMISGSFACFITACIAGILS